MSHFFSSLFVIPPPIAVVLVPLLQSIWAVWSATWWIFTPIIAAIIFWEAWLLYLHYKFLHKIKWKVLEIKVPKNILKTPKAMEQIFAAAHAPYSYGIRFTEKYIKGVGEHFMSFELVGHAGETHFYLRLPEQFRNMMESAIYAQYPEAEITEADDYLKQMPKILPNKDFDVAGFEEVFKEPNYFPIRTYITFEDSVEERRLDPIGSLMEAMSTLTGEQQFWFQMIVVPTGEVWKKEAQKALNKMLGIEDEHKKKSGLLPNFDLGFSIGEALRAPFEHPGEAKSKKEETKTKSQRFILSPGEKEVTEGIYHKISKLAFETTIRFLYLERRGESASTDKNMFLGHGFIRQFNTQDMNSLRPDKHTTSASYAIRGLFRTSRLRWRKRIIYERYQNLAHNHHGPILNIEELATLYHFPMGTVSTTELEKVASRKGSPPATVPLMEDGEN